MEDNISNIDLEETKKPHRGNPNFAKKSTIMTEPVEQVQQEPKKEKELINCLRKEKVIIRLINRKHRYIDNPHHLLYGGMAEGSTKVYTVPRTQTGQFVNVLTNDEKNYLEHIMGLEPNALSVYKKENNFWDDSNPNGVNQVRLQKSDNYLDLSAPEDYIKYKILLANKEFICKSLQELQDRPKATYQFVIVSESGSNEMAELEMTTTMRAYTEFGKISDKKEVLSYVIERLSGRPFITGNCTITILQTKVNEFIKADPKTFLSVATDKHLLTAVLIKRAIEAGIIVTRNNLLYYRKDNLPLCNNGQEATKSVAAVFLDEPKNQELKFAIEEEVNTKFNN